MDNVRVVIDAGHGGSDPGAIGNGYQEKDINLKISNYMYNRFNELGIPVKITRTTDETISPKDRTNEILAMYGNDPDVLVISNHINAGGGEGAEVLYALRNNETFAKQILDNIAAEGQKVRKIYQRRLPSNPTKDYNFLFRDTGVTEPVIVEYGFIDNASDINRVVNNYEKYAEAVVKAVTQYKGLPYTAPNLETSEGTILYTVKAGDSLWRIAKEYGTTVSAIKSLNGLSSDLLRVGQQLLVPSTTPTIDNQIYIVKAGDTLYAIANKYGTTVSAIKSLNNLTSNILSIGEQLLIPETGQSETPTMYVVKAGDSLWRIARNFNTTVNDIRTLNNLTTDLLSIGQVLMIP